MRPSSQTRELQNASTCPCCGHVMDAPLPVVDLNTNVVIWRDRRWEVSPKVAEFLYTIAKEAPRPVSFVDIGFAMWGAHAPYDQALNARCGVYAWHVRKMFAGTDVDIETITGRGYRLFVKPRENQ